MTFKHLRHFANELRSSNKFVLLFPILMENKCFTKLSMVEENLSDSPETFNPITKTLKT